MIRNGNIQETRSVNLDGLSPIDVYDRLAEAAEGLTDVRLNIELDWEWGDQVVRQYITGWRLATAAEIDADKTERSQRDAAQRERQEQDLARLREQRPDLF